MMSKLYNKNGLISFFQVFQSIFPQIENICFHIHSQYQWKLRTNLCYKRFTCIIYIQGANGHKMKDYKREQPAHNKSNYQRRYCCSKYIFNQQTKCIPTKALISASSVGSLAQIFLLKCPVSSNHLTSTRTNFPKHIFLILLINLPLTMPKNQKNPYGIMSSATIYQAQQSLLLQPQILALQFILHFCTKQSNVFNHFISHALFQLLCFMKDSVTWSPSQNK